VRGAKAKAETGGDGETYQGRYARRDCDRRSCTPGRGMYEAIAEIMGSIASILYTEQDAVANEER
jgi:hypothetical protein